MAVPNLPVLVFDGDCGFCTRSARWAERRLPSAVTVAPFQSLDLRALGILPTDVAAAAWWVEPDGRRQGGHRAAAAALRAMGGGWAVLGRIMAVPPVSWLARVVYRVVARYRHRMPGGTDACAVR